MAAGPTWSGAGSPRLGPHGCYAPTAATERTQRGAQTHGHVPTCVTEREAFLSFDYIISSFQTDHSLPVLHWLVLGPPPSQSDPFPRLDSSSLLLPSWLLHTSQSSAAHLVSAARVPTFSCTGFYWACAGGAFPALLPRIIPPPDRTGANPLPVAGRCCHPLECLKL